MNTRNPTAGHSAEAKGRQLAKAVSGSPAGSDGSGEIEKRRVDGGANAKGRELAQAVAADTVEEDRNSGNIGSQHSSSSDESRRSRIARAAYEKAEKRGFAPGGEIDDWILAERELSEKEGQGSIG